MRKDTQNKQGLKLFSRQEESVGHNLRLCAAAPAILWNGPLFEDTSKISAAWNLSSNGHMLARTILDFETKLAPFTCLPDRACCLRWTWTQGAQPCLAQVLKKGAPMALIT